LLLVWKWIDRLVSKMDHNNPWLTKLPRILQALG
jgi:hypothetical protein